MDIPSLVKYARDYGLNANQLSAETGLEPDLCANILRYGA